MSKKNCKPIKYCRLCLDTKLKTVFDLEKTPLANSFLDKKQIKKKQILYPLKLNFCLNCNHLQLSHSVSAGAMFNNYLYLTNTSRQNRNHFKKYAKNCVSINGLNLIRKDAKTALEGFIIRQLKPIEPARDITTSPS